MALSVAQAIGIFGILFSVSVGLFHAYRAARARDTMAKMLASYYTLSMPYVTFSGMLTAFFFIAVAFPSKTASLFGNPVLMDTTFFGMTLVWIWSASRVFHATDMMSESFFAEGGDWDDG